MPMPPDPSKGEARTEAAPFGVATWRAVSRRIARLVATGATALATTLTLTAFSPPVGSEFMLTDAEGGRFVGVGTLRERELTLELSERLSEVRVVLVRPDGEARTYAGVVRDGRLYLDEDGAEIDVARALAGAGRSLRLVWPDETVVIGSDDASRPREADAPDATPDDDGASDEGDDARDGDGAEDEGGDGDRGAEPPDEIPAPSVPPVDEPPLDVPPRDEPPRDDLPHDDAAPDVPSTGGPDVP